jgi:hypothetical protein
MTGLTVTDNADGTGATAAISGSAGGANTVFVAAVTGTITASAWVGAGACTGDGAVTLALPKGYYFAHCLTAPAALSGLAYFAVTDGRDPVVSRCFAAAKAQLQLLALPCTQRVFDSQFADNLALQQFPCVVLTTEDARESDEATLNGRDDIGHAVRVLVKDVCLKFDDARRDTYRAWRQAIFRAFHNQRLPGVVESVRNKVELGPVAAVSSGEPQVVSELLIRCITREVRGLGA